MAVPADRQFDFGHADNTYDSSPNGSKRKEDMVGDNGLERAGADDLLNVLGYASELTRSRSTFQVAFMSFVLASVPYGLSTTLAYPLIGGGPVAVLWGWVGVCLIILCLAISLGEITSVYPTAGGVYYQTYMLSPPWCRNITAWICGWCYFLGNVTITLAVNFGTSLFLIGCVNIFTDIDGNPIWVASNYQVFLVFLAITFLCNAISSLCNKWLPLLDVSRHSISMNYLPNQVIDIRNLLDLCWSDCNFHLHPSGCQERTQQRWLRLRKLHSIIRLDARMVILHWFVACCLCYLCNRHDSLVSRIGASS